MSDDTLRILRQEIATVRNTLAHLKATKTPAETYGYYLGKLEALINVFSLLGLKE